MVMNNNVSPKFPKDTAGIITQTLVIFTTATQYCTQRPYAEHEIQSILKYGHSQRVASTLQD